MSTAILGHTFGVLPRRKKFDNLQDSDLERLSEQLDVTREEPKQLSVEAKSAEEVKAEAKAAKARIQETIDKFGEVIKAGEQMKILLKKKLENRTVRVDPNKNPAVRDAIRRVFGINSDTITYDMFEKALEIRSKLSKEGRASYVTYDTGT
jgi:hypothetical protein